MNRTIIDKPALGIRSHIRDHALRTIGERGLLADDPAPLVIMVSGGSDSTALCLLTRDLVAQGILAAERVTVLHVDHSLRGEDSRLDSRFVRHLAELSGFPFALRVVDVVGCLGDYGGNVENAGRHLRYEAAAELLDDRCRAAGTPLQQGRIWVAHTQDDRVETFFMRAIVGTGPGGFAAMRHRNGRVCRPLLDATRDELRAYVVSCVDEEGWELDPPASAQVEGGYWREDRTNLDTAGFRAFVRHKIVPAARERNPRLGDTLGRTLDRIADEDDYMEHLTDAAMAGRLRETQAGVDLDLRGFEEIAVPLKRRIVYRICRAILPEGERIEQRHIDLILDSIMRTGFAIDLPGQARIRNARGVLVASRPAAPRDAADPPAQDPSAQKPSAQGGK